jgi:hypothetical protein
VLFLRVPQSLESLLGFERLALCFMSLLPPFLVPLLLPLLLLFFAAGGGLHPNDAALHGSLRLRLLGPRAISLNRAAAVRFALHVSCVALLFALGVLLET